MRTYTADEVDEMIGRALAREREKQAEQAQPHGWYIDGYGAVLGKDEPKSVRPGQWSPFYTEAPRQQLTDEELEKVFPAIATYHEANKSLYRSIARAIESAHGIKGEA